MLCVPVERAQAAWGDAGMPVFGNEDSRDAVAPSTDVKGDIDEYQRFRKEHGYGLGIPGACRDGAQRRD